MDAWEYLPGVTGDAWERMCGTSGDAWARLAGTIGDAWERLIVACVEGVRLYYIGFSFVKRSAGFE